MNRRRKRSSNATSDGRAEPARAKPSHAKATRAKATRAASARATSASVLSAPPSSVQRKRAAAKSAGDVAGPRAKRASARREAILAAALAEFSRRGFAATRIDDVARRARVAKGTIYLYFKDKDALFQELVRSTLVPTLSRLVAPLPEGLPTRALFEAFADIFIEEIVATPRVEIVRLMIAEGKQFPALAEFYYREIVTRGLSAMRALIERGRARGEIRVASIEHNPQLAIAPLMVTIVWNGLFGKFAKVDARDMMKTQLDLIFGQGRPE
jgi:AcrR family transcriptional regulator